LEQQSIDADLAGFVSEHIESVDQLEVFLLLARAAGRRWDEHELSTELRTSDLAARLTLDHLGRRGLLEIHPGDPPQYAFPSGDGRLAQLATRLERAYQERRVSMISLIYSKPERPESDPVHLFAEAFRIKPKDPRR
jgi:hypothetical protein